MKLVSFDFIIKHRLEKINFVDEFSRRSNYHDVNTKIIRLLFILQTKLNMIAFLHLQFSDIRAIIIVVFANITRIVSYENEISRSKIVIFVFISLEAKERRRNDKLKQYLFRAVIAILAVNENSYENSFEFILNFIKILQKKKFLHKHVLTMSLRRINVSARSFSVLIIFWTMKFLKFRNRYYVLEKEFLRAKLLKRHYDDAFVEHLNVNKIVELLNKKYYWSKMTKYVQFYVDTCDIC